MTVSKIWFLASACVGIGMVVGAGFSELRHREPERAVAVAAQQSAGTKTGKVASASTMAGRSLTADRAMGEKAGTPMLAGALKKKDHLHRRRDFEDLGMLMAGKNLEEAFKMQKKLGPADQQSLVRGIFHVLAKGDRAFALSQMSRCEDLWVREAGFSELAKVWEPGMQASLAISQYVGSTFVRAYLLGSDPPQTELALLWADQLSRVEGKGEVLQQIANKLLDSSPAEALKVGDRLHGEDYVDFVNSITQSWAEKDPQAALAWSDQIEDKVFQASVQQRLAEAWVDKDVHSAQAQLQIEPVGVVRDSLLALIANKLGDSDTEAAFVWVNTLSNPMEKARALENVQKVAPIGIGAQIKADGPWPKIIGLVQGAAAAASQQVSENDRILAVDPSGNGEFISTRGMSSAKVSAMLKGQAGTKLRLEVTSLNEDGFATPRVVPLTRSQVMFKPPAD